MTQKMALGIILILVFLFLGCTFPAPLKVGTLPVIDSLPLSLARHKPIFAENNLGVETLYFDRPSQLRDALMNGEVDAIITDVIGALLLNEGQEGGKIVRVALRASPNRPMFAIMGGEHRFTTVHGLQNARIAVSSEPYDRYVTDKLLSAAGINRWTEIEVSNAEIGLEMLQKGEVTAALLPEPLISLAMGNGAQIVIDDKTMMLGQTVVAFSQRMVDKKPALIRRFLRAYEQAARELNARPEQYRSLVMELVPVPSEVSASLPIPVFPFPGEVPTESEVESANAWLTEKRMVSQPIPYRQVVNAGFLWDPYQFHPAACCGW